MIRAVTTHKERLPSPARIKSDMDRLTSVAVDAVVMARAAAAGYEELHEASLMPRVVGEPMPMGRSGFTPSDPTGEVATSRSHIRMRYQARRVAAKLRTAMESVEEAERIITSAFAETDPEFAEKMRRLRELEREVRGLGQAR